MIKTLANGYSYESAQRELSNEYQHDRVKRVIQNLCIIVLGMKVASALEGLSLHKRIHNYVELVMLKILFLSFHAILGTGKVPQV